MSVDGEMAGGDGVVCLAEVEGGDDADEAEAAEDEELAELLALGGEDAGGEVFSWFS